MNLNAAAASERCFGRYKQGKFALKLIFADKNKSNYNHKKYQANKPWSNKIKTIDFGF